jgi:hypothetical protein
MTLHSVSSEGWLSSHVRVIIQCGEELCELRCQCRGMSVDSLPDLWTYEVGLAIAPKLVGSTLAGRLLRSQLGSDGAD